MRRPRGQTVAIALAFPAMVAVSYGVAEQASDELDALTIAIYLVPILVFGMIVAKAWVLVLPLLWAVLFLIVFRLVDLSTGTCSVCTSDDNWGNFPSTIFVIAVIPMTFTLLVGLGLGRLSRPLRRSRHVQPAR